MDTSKQKGSSSSPNSAMDSPQSSVSGQQSGRKRSWSELVDSSPASPCSTVSTCPTCPTCPTTANTTSEVTSKKICVLAPCNRATSPLPAPCDGSTPRWETLQGALAYFGRHRQYSKMYRLPATVPPKESCQPSTNVPSLGQLLNLLTIVTWNSFFVHDLGPLLYSQDYVVPAASAVDALTLVASIPNFNFDLLRLLSNIICHCIVAFRLDVDLLTMALILIGRRRTSSPLAAAPHLQFMVAVMLAKKLLDDIAPSTATWAQALNTDRKELTDLEWEFTRAIDWRFGVGDEEWVLHKMYLKAHPVLDFVAMKERAIEEACFGWIDWDGLRLDGIMV